MVLGFSFSSNVLAQPGPDGPPPEMRKPMGNPPVMNRMHNGQPGRPGFGRPDGRQPGKEFQERRREHRPGFNNHRPARPGGPDGRPGMGRPDGRPGQHFQGRPGDHNGRPGFGRPDGRPGPSNGRPSFDRPGPNHGKPDV